MTGTHTMCADSTCTYPHSADSSTATPHRYYGAGNSRSLARPDHPGNTDQHGRHGERNARNGQPVVNAVFDQMVADISAEILARVAQTHKDTRAKMRAGLAAAIETMTDDPRRLRMFTEAEFNHALTQRRSDVVGSFAAILLSVGRERYGPDTIGRTGPRAQFAAMHLIGGLYGTMIGWTRGDLAVSRDELIELATDMLGVVGEHLTDTHPT
jgi:hypothetical protein